MPFPLAHPAAVLPLRRRCPQWFNFPALVIGSLSPDVGYCFGPLRLDKFSHRFIGSFEFCLPVGLALLLMFYLLRRPVVQQLPKPLRRVFEPLCLRPAGPLFIIVISLLVGSWTHIFLDATTHWNGWIVRHVPALQRYFVVGHSYFSVHGILYAFVTFAGSGCIALAFLNWLERTVDNPVWIFRGFKWIAAGTFAAGTLSLSFANHDLVLRSLATIGLLTAVLAAGLFVGTVWALREGNHAGLEHRRNRHAKSFFPIHMCTNSKGGHQK